VYLLFLDESGTHTSSPVRILSGLALHEQDAWYMQRALNEVLDPFLRVSTLWTSSSMRQRSRVQHRAGGDVSAHGPRCRSAPGLTCSRPPTERW